MGGAPPVLRFGVFELNLAKEELRKFGTLIKLAPQPFELLALLASQAGQIVTREQIRFQLWRDDTFVDFEQGMNHCIRQIRNTLGDNADTPRYIETLPRRGYRFIAPVRVIAAKVEESLVSFGDNNAPNSAPDDSASLSVPVATVGVATSQSSAVGAAVSAAPLERAVEATVGPQGRTSTRPWFAGAAIALTLAIAATGTFRILRDRSVAVSPSGARDVKHRKTIVVLGFKNLMERPDTGIPLSTALSTMLRTELAAGDHLRITSSAEVDRLKLEMHLVDADSLPRDMLQRLRKSLAADYVILGSCLEEGGQVRVDLRVQDTTSGEIIASIAESGTNDVSGLAAVASQAGASIRPKLGVPEISPTEMSGIRATQPADPAAELYYQGLARLREFDALAARDLLEKAVVAEPDFAPAHSALSQALSLLGYSKLAREEAEKAFNFSSSLPRQDRLLIEARYRELTGKWEQAIALYQTLWDSARDNIDYGINLASAQTKAGNGKDALATLQTLRSLPAPERDDLRIDLEEAAAAYSMGDYDREQVAADRAAKKAEALGGGFALARTRTAQAKALYYRDHYDEAMKMYRQALETSQMLGNKSEVASALNNIASNLYALGNFTAALEWYAKALVAFREIGNRSSTAATLNNMGSAYQLVGELGEAMNMYGQALPVYRELGDRLHEGIVTNNIAEVLYLTGDLRSARQRHEEALTIDRAIKNRFTEAEALFGIGQVLAAEGDLTGARRIQEKALQIRTDLKQEEYTLQSRVALAQISQQEGNATDAVGVARDAAEAFGTLNLRDQQLQALIVLARALLDQNQVKDAAQIISHANTVASNTQDRILRLELDLVSAQVLARSEDLTIRTQAQQTLSRVLDESTKAGYVQLQFEAALALGQAELGSGTTSAGQARLAALRQQASAKGWGFIARRAAAAERHTSPQSQQKTLTSRRS